MEIENTYKILGVRIDNFSKKEILEKVESFLCEDKFHQIATINPEFILEAQKNLAFKNILNNCDLNIVDGFGIKLAFWRYGWHLKTRMAGADLMQEILKIATNKNLSIFLATNKNGLSSFEEIKKAILKIYPNLEIAGADFNCHSRGGGNLVSHLSVFTLDSRSPIVVEDKFHGNDKDNISAHTIVFCNFGASQQEKFLHSLKNAKNSKIKLAMGVGGSFDFLTGKIIRAPKIIRAVGLEWLWRLILQPKRIKRIWNATVVFMIKIIF